MMDKGNKILRRLGPPQDGGEGAEKGRGVEIATPAEPARNDKVGGAVT